ncbi:MULTISPECIES: ABC-type transport auxiliary lipoprotein family protein [Nitrincola]|uniref:ABC-type uncharacterized transport system, auxiliary component n=1 Tax=Nitrincola nitratireducens TaxID=1229521 RepID=W9UXG9_9GAMM|nr:MULTISPECIES: ABC-type transport auxiliary lipoprotein family protein [Nitrincola]EXJ09401.1 ABC-type uncharacterized transport system, auxiliary component [Nitrincola nitratireducens]
MKYLRNIVSALLLSTVISGCALLPESGNAPVQLQLMPLLQENRMSVIEGIDTPVLVIERPQSTAALNGRAIWFQSGRNQLSPFRDHIWSESLPQQIEHLSIDYLSGRLSQVSVHMDRPGIDSDYRLRIHLHQWHLDQTSQRLLVVIHADLLRADGQRVVSWQWQHSEALMDVSAPGLAAAGQVWLQKWLDQVADGLQEYL